jgi:hypothetical protein
MKISIGYGINHKIKKLQKNTVQVIKLNPEYWVFLGYESASWGNQILTSWRNILSLLPSFSRLSRSFLGIYGPLKMRSEFLQIVWIQFPWTSSYPRRKSSTTVLQDHRTCKSKCSIQCSCVKTIKLYYWFTPYKGRSLQ